MNGCLKEDIYVKHSLGFKYPKAPNHVYKLHKAFYGLKQAPRVWYERLSSFLVAQRFARGKIDTKIFTKGK